MKITVFTPTYNRAYIIENLYQSLKRQTFRDFEWLVIDDGSVDNTEEIFREWKKKESSFTIRYYKQENSGKCVAINKALDLAKGTLFFTVDSDDYLTDDALEKIAKWESELPNDDMYCGVAGNLGTTKDKTPNRIFDSAYYEGNFFDRYKTVDGERAIAIYTKIHQQYKYPVFPDEKFMTEAVAWNRMAHDGYKMRFYNDIIWIYEYRDDGLTKAGNELFKKNPRGYALWLQEKLQFENGSILKKKKLDYTLTCELMPIYAKKKIAEYLSTSILWVDFYDIIHRILLLMKKRRPAMKSQA